MMMRCTGWGWGLVDPTNPQPSLPSLPYPGQIPSLSTPHAPVLLLLPVSLLVTSSTFSLYPAALRCSGPPAAAGPGGPSRGPPRRGHRCGQLKAHAGAAAAAAQAASPRLGGAPPVHHPTSLSRSLSLPAGTRSTPCCSFTARI